MADVPHDSLLQVRELVEGFHRNLKDYKHRSYLETPVRDDFIDPLFAALGWDMGNKLRLPEAAREVIEEGRICRGPLAATADGLRAVTAGDDGILRLFGCAQ